jgi:hypothetical protein
MIIDLLKSKGIKDSSIKLYLSNLKRLNNNNDIKTLTFLKNSKKVLDFINNKSENTKRTYLISICTVLNLDPKYKKNYDEYYKLLKESNGLLKNNTTKSEKQEENWMEQDEITTIYKNIESEVEKFRTKKKLNESEYNIMLNYVILSLYTLIPPRRSLDYIKMLIGNDTNKDFNYIDINDSKFIFNNFKTAGTYKTQIIDIPDNLMSVIKLYLTKRKGVKSKLPFLVNFKGEPLTTSSQMTRILNKIFNKKVSVSMLRNMFLTNKYKDINKEKIDDATAMGTSSSNADNQYIKLD